MLEGQTKPKNKAPAAKGSATKAPASKASASKAPTAKTPSAKAPASKGPAGKPPATKPGGGYDAQRGALKPPASKTIAPKGVDKVAPKAPVAESLVLPDSTTELLESTALQVSQVASYQGAKAMPAPIAKLLVHGVEREGVSDASGLQAILTEYIDGGEVNVYSVVGAGKSLQWLRFWCGDTEVGYLFDGSKLVAIVGDQQINPV